MGGAAGLAPVLRATEVAEQQHIADGSGAANYRLVQFL